MVVETSAHICRGRGGGISVPSVAACGCVGAQLEGRAEGRGQTIKCLRALHLSISHEAHVYLH